MFQLPLLQKHNSVLLHSYIYCQTLHPKIKLYNNAQHNKIPHHIPSDLHQSDVLDFVSIFFTNQIRFKPMLNQTNVEQCKYKVQQNTPFHTHAFLCWSPTPAIQLLRHIPYMELLPEISRSRLYHLLRARVYQIPTRPLIDTNTYRAAGVV